MDCQGKTGPALTVSPRPQILWQGRLSLVIWWLRSVHNEVERYFHLCFRVLHLHPSTAQFNFSCLSDTLVWLSHQHNPPYFSAVIPAQQRAGNQGVGTGMQPCHDQELHLQVIKESLCSCTGPHLQTPLEAFHL